MKFALGFLGGATSESSELIFSSAGNSSKFEGFGLLDVGVDFADDFGVGFDVDALEAAFDFVDGESLSEISSIHSRES